MKIIFIINAISNQRCTKRLNEFIDNGYNVVAYGFSRNIEMHSIPQVKINIIDNYPNSLPYHKRLSLLTKGIKHIVSQHKNENVIYYLFGLDIAMIFRFVCKRPYIYEESDLTHTYIKNKIIRSALEHIDKYIIKNSTTTIFTSEGFIKYHYKNKKHPNNITIIPNRLPISILQYNYPTPSSETNIKNLKIGFVGGARFVSIAKFSEYVLKKYPFHEIHFYGYVTNRYKSMFESLKIYPNCYFHGPFISPNDLPKIYSNIDLVLSTYDIEFENIRYAEPNKLYEAIFFNKPIIVTKGTYLSEKVEKLQIGYSIDPLNPYSIQNFLNNITIADYKHKLKKLREIDIRCTLNENTSFFNNLSKILHK